MKRYLITLALVALLAVAGTVFAAPSSVDRITNRIEPLIKTDFIRAVYFVATSTTASSTFANGLNITAGCFAVNNVCITAGGGGGSGVVNPGTQGQNAFYDSTGAIVSGTSTIFVSTASNVGIGTTTPTSKLSVIGSISGDSVNTTSTTATSTFLGKLQVGTYAGVPQIVGPDIDTGIHFDGPDIFSVHTGGTTRFLINSSGNVGIGTTTPSSNLDVRGSTGIYTRSSSGGRIVFDDTDVADASTPMSYITGADGSIQFGRANRAVSGLTTGTTESVRITSVGNVGIGITDPTTKLVVSRTYAEPVGGISSTTIAVFSNNNSANGTSTISVLSRSTGASGIYFGDQTGEAKGGIFYGGNNPGGQYQNSLAFLTLGTEKMRIDGAGNVGIGTTSPFAKLAVENTGTGNSFIVSDQSTDTSPFIIDTAGNVGIGTTSPYAKLSVVGPVVAQSFHATSTTATSTFQGNVVLSPDGQNPYGFAAGPLVIEGPLAGPYQAIIANTLDSAVSLAGLTIGNSKFRNPGFSADYYCGFYMAAASYALPGLDGVLPNGGALFCKDGPITIGSATSTTGPEIRFQATGMGANNLDAVIEGSTGHFGIGTTSPMARLDVAGPSTGNLFQVSSVSGSATTSRLFVAGGGNVGLGTTTPRAPLDIGGLIPGNVGGINSGQASVLISQNFNNTSGVGMVNMNNGAAAEFRFAISDSAFNDYIAFNQPNPSNSGTLFGETKASSSLIFTNGTGNRRLLMGTVNAAPVAFGTSNTERMRIDSSGNLGYGTNTASSTFHVVAATGMINQLSANNNNGATFGCRKSRGSISAYADVQNADQACVLSASVYSSGWFSTAQIAFTVDGTFTTGQRPPSAIQFFTNTANGSVSERMRLMPGGTLGIGTTTPIGQLNMSSTSPTLTLSDTTNASHWNIANNDGVFSLSTTSSALVRTETNAVTILNNGNFGVSSSTPAEEFSIGGVGSATSTAYFDSGTGKGSCMIIADTDGSGVTYVTANNGVLTASTVPCN